MLSCDYKNTDRSNLFIDFLNNKFRNQYQLVLKKRKSATFYISEKKAFYSKYHLLYIIINY